MAASGASVLADEIVDTDRLPIARPGPDRDAWIAGLRAAMDQDGCAVVPRFVRPGRIAELVAECDRVSRFAHRAKQRTNPYFTSDRPDLPEDHPLRRFHDRSNAFVPADHFGDTSILRVIYHWPAFAPFVQEVLGDRPFHRYADPLADVIVNVTDEGDGFPWHFDTNNHTVTLAIQNSDRGGRFEYCPRLRTSSDENYQGVAAVLDGAADHLVRSLDLRPGDLQIFAGRHSLHRVTPVAGPTPRYVGIFSFVEEPGMVGSPERTRQLYGRVLPIHLERAGRRADALVD